MAIRANPRSEPEILAVKASQPIYNQQHTASQRSGSIIEPEQLIEKQGLAHGLGSLFHFLPR
jgi:hypothetical protein